MLPLVAPDHLPLALIGTRVEFAWDSRPCAIIAQRNTIGSDSPHPDLFYIQVPDGSIREISVVQMRRHLEHPPASPTPEAIAHSWERESHQHDPHHLRNLLITCSP
jgi:hypothetical protein